MTDRTFMELCIAGEAKLADVDDYIDKWHESSGETTLHEYLGLTWNEYVEWAKNPQILEDILKKRKSKPSPTPQ